MATVIVNDIPVDIGTDKLNCVQAAERGGVEIPHYCWHPALTVVASCRMCLVEVGEKKPDGTVTMQPKVVPGCQTPVKDGTVIVTNTAKARAAQAQTLEGLLLNHPLDCPVCDKAGECKLQDYSYTYGNSKSRMVDVKNTPPNKPGISSKITLFTDRCIMCSRCVRFTREIAGTAELTIVGRGTHEEIDIFPGRPLENKMSGNVVDLCPVGALGSKDFLYKQRVWFLKSTKSVCPSCSTGCSVEVDANKDVIFRLRPRENPLAQGHFMCDEGRWGFHYAKSNERLKRPLMKTGGLLTPDSWANVLASLRERLSGKKLLAVVSPWLTCEEALLFCLAAKAADANATLVLGPVPVAGEDDTYPKDRRGNPTSTVKFTIRAEKAPNRRGVEQVLGAFAGRAVKLSQVDAGSFGAVWLTGSYPTGDWLDAATALALRKASVVVVQDLFPSPLSREADYVLPSAAWAEKEGTFVNHAGLAQPIARAVHAPGECRTEGQVFADFLGRRGLLNAVSVRAELAAAVAAFAPLPERLPEFGVKLELPVIANGVAR